MAIHTSALAVRIFCSERRPGYLSVAIAVLIAFLTGPRLLAQTATATIVGEVRDPTGAAIAGASLEVRNTDTNAVRKAASDEKGEFTIPELPPAPYEVTITKEGFRILREDGDLARSRASRPLRIPTRARRSQPEH